MMNEEDPFGYGVAWKTAYRTTIAAIVSPVIVNKGDWRRVKRISAYLILEDRHLGYACILLDAGGHLLAVPGLSCHGVLFAPLR